MPWALRGVYFAIYAAGLYVVSRKYKGTRAYRPGIISFFLLAVAQAGNLGVSQLDRSGPAFLTAHHLMWLARCLAVLVLVAALFLMTSQERGIPAKRLFLSAGCVAVLGLLAVHFAVYFDKRISVHWFVYESVVAGIGALAMLLRFRATRSSALAAAGLAVLAFAHFNAIFFHIPVGAWLTVAMTIASWGLIFAFMLTAPSPPETPGLAPGNQALRYASPLAVVLPLFYWQVYETIAGGPLTSHFLWAGIPLPLVLLVVAWFFTCAWLVLLFTADYARENDGKNGPRS